MNLNNLFESSIQKLEQQRIKDLEARMDDLAERAHETQDPKVKAALRHEFAKAKAERDEYYKLNVEEGYQDFKKPEPYYVCIAGKPIERHEFYDRARRHRDNLIKSLRAKGDPRADQVTLMPIIDEHGGGVNDVNGYAAWRRRANKERGITKGYVDEWQNSAAGEPEQTELEPVEEAGSPAQQAAIAINMKRHHKKPKHVDEGQVIPFNIPDDNVEGNYEQLNLRKNPADRYGVIDHTFNKLMLTSNDLKQAKTEAIEWADYDDIKVSVVNQKTGKTVFVVDGALGAEKYMHEGEMKRSMDRPVATSPHTVCKRVGGDWIAIEQHDSEPQAQRHAQNIKMKYPSMQIGVKTPAGEYRMIGLKENDDDGDYDNDPDPTHHAQVTKKDIQRAKVYPDHVNRAIAKSPKYRDDIIADYERRLKQGVEENILPEPKNEKEYMAQREKLVRMLSMEQNRANVQILVQAIKDLDRKAKNSSYISESVVMELAPNVKIDPEDKPSSTRYPKVKQAMTKYRKEFPGVSDIEAVVGHAYKTDIENAQQQREIDRLQKQEKELYDKIEKTNHELRDKEKRFQDWTKKVVDMDLTPRQAAVGANDIEAGRDIDMKKVKAVAPAKPAQGQARAAKPAAASSTGWLTVPNNVPAPAATTAQSQSNIAQAPTQTVPAATTAANDSRVAEPETQVTTPPASQPQSDEFNFIPDLEPVPDNFPDPVRRPRQAPATPPKTKYKPTAKTATQQAIGKARAAAKSGVDSALRNMSMPVMTMQEEVQTQPSPSKEQEMENNWAIMYTAWHDNLPAATISIDNTPITAYRSQIYAYIMTVGTIYNKVKQANTTYNILGSTAGWYNFIESTRTRNLIQKEYPKHQAKEKQKIKKQQAASGQASLPGLELKEASMAWAANKPTGPKFGGYLKGTDPAPTEFSNKGVGGCEEDIQVGEGAKVDRMQKHIAKSERKLGHSKKDAEAIGWATLNKRGYLDNKNKRPHEESLNFMEWTVAQGSRFANFTAKPEVYKAARAAYLKEGMSNALSNISRRMAGPVGAKKIIKNREQLQDKLGRSHFAEEETDPEVERSIAAAKSLPAIDAKISKHQQHRQDLERKMAALDAELARKDQADQEYWQRHAPRATRIKEPSRQLEASSSAKPGWALDPKTRLELKKRQARQQVISKWAGKTVPATDKPVDEVADVQPNYHNVPAIHAQANASAVANKPQPPQALANPDCFKKTTPTRNFTGDDGDFDTDNVTCQNLIANTAGDVMSLDQPTIGVNRKWAFNERLKEAAEVDELAPGEYYIWTVYFDDGSSKRIKVTQDTFDPKAFYAKQNRVVVNVKYDWEPHRERLSNIPG